MNIRLNNWKLYLFGGFFIIQCWSINVRAIQPPFSTEDISSDYSPRIHPITNLWDFHFAEDYNPGPGDSDLNMPIISPESANIDGIIYSPSGGWIISFVNGTKTWRYLHLFSDQQPSIGNNVVAGNFEVGITTTGTYFIIRNAFENHPEKAFCKDPNLDARSGLRTTNEILDREPIAPIGNSGQGDGVHLHMDVEMNGRRINPLLVLEHEPTNLSFKVDSPINNAMIGPSLWANYPFSVTINSINGKDLNHVTFLIDGQPMDGLNPTFSYAGLPAESGQTNIRATNNYTVTGVEPIKGTFEDEFVYRKDLSQLSEGQHTFLIRTEDIEGNTQELSTNFFIDKTPPNVPSVTDTAGSMVSAGGILADNRFHFTAIDSALDRVELTGLQISTALAVSTTYYSNGVGSISADFPASISQNMVPGRYQLAVYDQAGNKKTFTFYKPEEIWADGSIILGYTAFEPWRTLTEEQPWRSMHQGYHVTDAGPFSTGYAPWVKVQYDGSTQKLDPVSGVCTTDPTTGRRG